MSWKVYIDFDRDSSFATAGDEITAYVKAIDIGVGMRQERQAVADIGTCDITLNNVDKRFSPAYSMGIYYGKLLPRLPVKVDVIDGPTTYTIFRGYTDMWQPTSGDLRERECAVSCVDTLAILQGFQLDVPLLEDIRSDTLITHLVNFGLGAPFASGTLTFTANPSDGDTATINGTAYRFKNTLAAINDVQIGAAKEDTADSLKVAVNGEPDSGTDYYAGTTRPAFVEASVASNIVTLTALLPGTAGNAYTLSESSGGITASGATLSGGVDYPAGLMSYSTGVRTFDIAADAWSNEKTNALSAITEVVESEQGRFWIARDGTVCFRNQNYIFSLIYESDSITVDGEGLIDGSINIEDVYNRVVVQVTPRSTLASGVIARSTAMFSVPGNSTKTFTFPFVDPATGNPMGARDLSLPLEAGTDWEAWESSSGGSGYYDNYTYLTMSIEAQGSNAKVTITNTATGELYFPTFQINGTGLVKYNPATVEAEDTASQTAYGKRTLSVSLPLASDLIFAEALADYLLSRYKNPFYRVESIDFGNQNNAGGVSLYSLDIGDVMNLSEPQTGVDSLRHEIIGLNYSITVETMAVSFVLRRLDDVTYGIFDSSIYGLFDNSLRFAI